ncbi:MAG TPA: MFS transporter [Acidimicrobiales bacterium]|nr:MFS transporter [Acidimicrobiales bacterium]
MAALSWLTLEVFSKKSTVGQSEMARAARLRQNGEMVRGPEADVAGSARPGSDMVTLASPRRLWPAGVVRRPRTTDELQGPEGRRGRFMVLGICSLSLFMSTLDNTIVNVALPALQHQFHASVTELQWVADAYLIVLAALLLLSGSLGDRFGRRKVLRIGLVIFGAGSLACSLSVNLPMLVACRMLQACGGCMLNPNSLSIITDTFRDRRERAAAIGFWGGVVGVSTAGGPVLGGALIDAIDWRAIFWVNVPVVLAALVLVALFVPEPRVGRARHFDALGQVLAIMVLAALSYGIIEGPVRGWESTEILGCFAVVLIGAAGFVAVERRQPEPMLDFHFFRSPPFSGAAAIAVVAHFVLAGWLFINTIYLQEVRHYSPFRAGTAALPATVVIAVVAPLTGRVVGRRGARLPLSVAGAFIMASTSLQMLVEPTSSYLFLGTCYLLLGLGFGMVNPPIANAAVSGMPPNQTGVAAAVASTSRQVGSALGVAVLGSVVTSGIQGQLASRLAGSGLPARVQAAARAASTNLSATSAGLPVAAQRLVGDAFSAAAHASFAIAAACGLAITVIALVTTGPRAMEAARRTMAADAPAEKGPTTKFTRRQYFRDRAETKPR